MGSGRGCEGAHVCVWVRGQDTRDGAAVQDGRAEVVAGASFGGMTCQRPTKLPTTFSLDRLLQQKWLAPSRQVGASLTRCEHAVRYVCEGTGRPSGSVSWVSCCPTTGIMASMRVRGVLGRIRHYGSRSLPRGHEMLEGLVHGRSRCQKPFDLPSESMGTASG
jgi:hypothetical protein